LIEGSAAYQPWIWISGNHDIEFLPQVVCGTNLGKQVYFVSKKGPQKKLEYRVMNIFEALPRFAGPAEGGSPRYHPLRLGPKIVGKCSLPYRNKISKFETLQKRKVLS
jgi:hypothetical protein